MVNFGGIFMNNRKNQTPIYLDKEGYDNFLEDIEELKRKLNANNKERKNAFDAGAGDGWDSPEFEEIERNERMLSGELQRKYDELSRVVIIEKKANSDVVNIGDIIKADMYYSDDDIEEELFKLVGGMPAFDLNAGIQEISINSPIGDAIYQRKIGDKCSYSVNGSQFYVLIKEKLNFEKQQEEPDKVLKK